jgi:hypothetical protein
MSKFEDELAREAAFIAQMRIENVIASEAASRLLTPDQTLGDITAFLLTRSIVPKLQSLKVWLLIIKPRRLSS